MNSVLIALVAVAILVVLAGVRAGGVVLYLRLRAGEPININLRFLFRLYLLVVIVAGLMVFAQGSSNLVQAGFASIGGKQFSYTPAYVPGPPHLERVTPSALELKDRAQLTDTELEELSVIQAERGRQRSEMEEERRRLGLDRALKEGLIQGISFLVIVGLPLRRTPLAGNPRRAG